jgi:hypothetical protein
MQTRCGGDSLLTSCSAASSSVGAALIDAARDGVERLHQHLLVVRATMAGCTPYPAARSSSSLGE